jgi:2,4-dienoyl-CoA reductase-like NADH-dependent reductase (Old Yellow Enzyme family)
MVPESPLFQPLRLGGLTVNARLFKTATSETRASVDGFVTDELLAFYEPLARAQTPLIVTGNLYVHESGKTTPRMAGVDDDNKIAGLKRLTDLAHRHGARLVAQLNHGGRQVLPAGVGLTEAVSASNVKEKLLGTVPRAMSISEIKETVAHFADAAARCQRAGFDGVQIHAAHGYLLSQFLTPYTNRRTDDYGGSFDNRLRFLREAVRAVRSRVGAGYPILVKLNGSDYLALRAGLSTDTLVRIAKVLEQDGVDAIEISVGHYESGLRVVRGTFTRYFRDFLKHGLSRGLSWPRRLAIALGWPFAALACNLLWWHFEGFNLGYARRFKEALTIPVIAVGGFLTREAMEKPLANGHCDAVSCGRAMIADPFLYRHLQNAEAGPRCTFCNACAARIGVDALDCFHPRVRAEKDDLLQRMAVKPKARQAEEIPV